MDLTNYKEIRHLAQLTGLSPEEVLDAVGGIAFRRRLYFARKEHVDRWAAEEKAARRILKASADLRNAIASFQSVALLPDPSLEVSALEDMEARISADLQIYAARPLPTPEGERSWPSVIIAAAVARVFTRAGLPLTIGEREGKNGREPSTAYCWAVLQLLTQFHVNADFRRAAERGRDLRDEA